MREVPLLHLYIEKILRGYRDRKMREMLIASEPEREEREREREREGTFREEEIFYGYFGSFLL